MVDTAKKTSMIAKMFCALMEELALTKWEGSIVIVRKLSPKNSEYNVYKERLILTTN